MARDPIAHKRSPVGERCWHWYRCQRSCWPLGRCPYEVRTITRDAVEKLFDDNDVSIVREGELRLIVRAALGKVTDMVWSKVDRFPYLAVLQMGMLQRTLFTYQVKQMQYMQFLLRIESMMMLSIGACTLSPNYTWKSLVSITKPERVDELFS